MKVYCACGKGHSVKETMAGDEIPCECGKVVTVPSLSKLQGYRPEVQLRARFYDEQYWDKQGCFLCNTKPTTEAKLFLHCEPAETAGSGEPPTVTLVAASLATVFGFCLAPLIALFFWISSASNRVKIKEENVVRMPLELCSECIGKKDTEERCIAALREDEEGSELFRDYPELFIRVVLPEQSG